MFRPSALAGILMVVACGQSRDRPAPAQSSDGGEAFTPPHFDPASPGCDTLDPKLVYLIGLAGLETRALVSLTEPPTFCFSPASYSFVIRPSDGRLLQALPPNDKTIREFRVDALDFYDARKQWLVYAPSENDPHVATKGEAYDPLVWPDTSEVAYVNAEGTFTYDGRLITKSQRPHLGYAGHVFDGMQIVDSLADGGTSLIKDAELASSLKFIQAVRSTPDGFRIAVGSEMGTAISLWLVRFDGSATKLGVVADPPPGYSNGFRPLTDHPLSSYDRFDAEGNLYTFGIPTDATSGRDLVVLKRPLQPAASTIVYDSAGRRGDLTITPPKIGVILQNGGILVTGP